MTLKSFNTRYVKLIRKMTMISAGVLLVAVGLLTHWSAGATGFDRHPAEADNSMPAFTLPFLNEQKLTVSDGAQGDNFGFTIAASGSTIVVGARGDDLLQGASYVFERQGGSWVETQKLTASDGEAGDQFGDAVAVSGSTIVVGAPRQNIGGNFAQGSAYVFERRGGSWVETQKLTASDAALFDSLGRSVAVSGSTIVVGAVNKDAAYVFNRLGGSWVETQKLTASDAAEDDAFGVSVAISGSTIVVGASFDDIGSNINQGSVYVFDRRGGSWIETQKLTASDGAQPDTFGDPVAISGSTIVVGVAFDDIGSNINQGSVYVFNRRGGSWVETQRLTANDGGNSDIFGISLAISGSTIVVGASLGDVGNNVDQGSAYVFDRRGGSWVQTQKLTSSDGVAVDNFGRSVAASGSTIAVGAPFVDIGGNINQGAAYVFEP